MRMTSYGGNYKAILFVLVIVALSYITVSGRRIASLKDEAARYKNNTEALLEDVERYRVLDSLSGARVESLELTVKEYERYRAEDARLIKALKAKNRDLAAVASTQTNTVIDLHTVVRDTVIIRDSVEVKAAVVHCGDPWYDFDGMLAGDKFTGELVCRDSLLVAETVRRGRFLGFLWKTGRCKDRKVDVVSRNPHTKIIGVEHVVIEK